MIEMKKKKDMEKEKLSCLMAMYMKENIHMARETAREHTSEIFFVIIRLKNSKL